MAKRPAIVHVSSAHPWTDNRIHYRECETLAAAGLDVTLIAVQADVAAAVGDVRVLRIPRRSRLKRFVVSAPQAIWLAIRTRAKVVHVHDPELSWGVPILRALGRKVVFDAHEDLPVDVLNKPYVPWWAVRPLLLFAHLIIWLGGRANRVVAATEAIADRFPRGKTTVVRNYPPLLDEEEAVRIEDRENAALYVGAMSAIRGTAQLLDAAAHPVFPPGWRLILAGTPTPDIAGRLEDAAAVTRVENLGQLPPVEARMLLLRGKVGIVALQDTQAYRESLPTKMFEYFAAGLPVVASDFPLWRTIIEKNDCGLLVDASSPESIARAVATYDAQPELWRRHSANARRLAVEKLNWAAEGRRLVDLYRGLVG